MIRTLPLLGIALITGAVALQAEPDTDVATLVPWLLDPARELSGIPFPDVVRAVTGRTVHPVDPKADAALLEGLADAMNRTLAVLNDPAHPIHQVARINEASSFVEAVLRAELSRPPGWTCSIPTTVAGTEQRSGYPDLRLDAVEHGITYLDPKLFSEETRSTTLRTFYYEPKNDTSKVTEDARHLLIGICHNGKAGPELRLTGWEVVDLSKLRVRLKAEFQASNKDLYNNETIVARSEPK